MAALTQRAQDFALPEALAVCDWSGAAGKTMPITWATGRRMGFEVRACSSIH